MALTYSLVGNVLTATAGPGGATVFTFTLNPGGAWVFDLEDQLDHAPGAAENDLTIFLGSQIQATDFDGDIAPGGAVQIVVNDDTPVLATAGTIAVDEDDLLVAAGELCRQQRCQRRRRPRRSFADQRERPLVTSAGADGAAG